MTHNLYHIFLKLKLNGKGEKLKLNGKEEKLKLNG